MQIPLMWRDGSKRIRVEVIRNSYGMQQAVQPTLKGVYQLRYWDGKLVYETLKALDPIAVMIEADILRKKIAARLNPSGQGSVKRSLSADQLPNISWNCAETIRDRPLSNWNM